MTHHGIGAGACEAALVARKAALAPKACLWCGKDFSPQCAARWHRAKFCSRSCHGAWRGKASKGRPKGPCTEERKAILSALFTGKGNPNWKGGIQNKITGYTQVYLGTFHGRPVYELRHRLIVAAALGRALKPSETVHHIDLDRTNDANDNLLVCTMEYHAFLHRRMQEQWVKEHILAKRVG